MPAGADGSDGMISMAVVEDNEEFAGLLRRRILSETDWETAVLVSVYLSPEEFLREIAAGTQVDVAFLDVEMPGMNGMELAAGIRSRDKDMLLVFVSSFFRYAMEGYQVYAFDYLLKSQMDRRWDKLADRLRKALAAGREKLYTIQTMNRTERIPVDDILYIYKEEKYALIAVGAERIAVRKTMREIAEELRDHRQFVQVKKGILVNMEKVQKATARELLMQNGESIVIGRMYVDEVRERMHAYFGGK